MIRVSLFVSVLLALFAASLCFPSSSVLDRQKRGFRNSALSTARGFGKRMQPESERILDDIGLRNIDGNRDISANWFAEQLTRSPSLAKLIVDKAVDSNVPENCPSPSVFKVCTLLEAMCGSYVMKYTNIQSDGIITQEELFQVL